MDDFQKHRFSDRKRGNWSHDTVRNYFWNFNFPFKTTTKDLSSLFWHLLLNFQHFKKCFPILFYDDVLPLEVCVLLLFVRATSIRPGGFTLRPPGLVAWTGGRRGEWLFLRTPPAEPGEGSLSPMPQPALQKAAVNDLKFGILDQVEFEHFQNM